MDCVVPTGCWCEVAKLLLQSCSVYSHWIGHLLCLAGSKWILFVGQGWALSSDTRPVVVNKGRRLSLKEYTHLNTQSVLILQDILRHKCEQSL